MKYFIDFATGSLNKHGEELCGDKVEFYNDENQAIAVLSDGLRSGVKANILATLTSKIAITMLKEGMTIEEVVDTVTKTLPVCSVTNLAYSTFTIIKVAKDRMVYIAEFDSPNVFFLRNGKIKDLEWVEIEINNKKIRESKFKIQEGDVLISVSDGVIHAGEGNVLNLNWEWKDVAKYLEDHIKSDMSAKTITNTLLGACDQLYLQQPGDDTTVLTIKDIKPKKAVLFSGPPLELGVEKHIVNEIIKNTGKKMVCGGTTSHIVAKHLNQELKIESNSCDKGIPPISYIRGIDLVTEGVITITKATEKLERLKISTDTRFLYESDGASKLARMLFEDCTHIKLIIGRAINPAHQNKDFPNEISVKLYVMNKLKNILTELGKIVEVEYY